MTQHLLRMTYLGPARPSTQYLLRMTCELKTQFVSTMSISMLNEIIQVNSLLEFPNQNSKNELIRWKDNGRDFDNCQYPSHYPSADGKDLHHIDPSRSKSHDSASRDLA
jgi:hypothetical protein